ncbi:hypothetical protein DMC30DRAFT_54588 [Rhodotorula diobovata]|uniref:Uncharacterized protein n=1 Tax=Rhodotorula diobovata TaxID=5288 RepID=A0A5C5FNJ4_9BASI|nr:hypothetical protein DMC30DRAFT_54588 [Rhodotorula diobovata]
MPACSSSSTTASSSRAAASLPYAKPTPKPRRAPSSATAVAADPALDTLGAVYIGWGAGKRDPAPLCCAVQARASLVRAFGEAAVGWMTVQPQAPPQQPLATLPLGALPPLPPLPRTSTNSTSSSSSSSSSSSAAASSLSPGLAPSLTTPATSTGSPNDLFLFDEALLGCTDIPVQAKSGAFAPSFEDATLAPVLPLTDSRPSSPRLSSSAPLQPHPYPSSQQQQQQSNTSFVPSFSLSLPSVPEDAPAARIKREPSDEDADDEALWSAGEDPLWNCAATDVTSEASWAW